MASSAVFNGAACHDGLCQHNAKLSRANAEVKKTAHLSVSGFSMEG